MHVLLTAGATRNPVDTIRYLSAHSSGVTGLTLARALAERGIDVTFLGSAEACLRAEALGHARITPEEFTSTRNLLKRMKRHVTAFPRGGVVHAAAVGDYEVAQAEAGKIPSGLPELTLRLTRAPNIADEVRGWGLTGPFATFKAAPPDTDHDALRRIAEAQRERTGCDVVFANVLGRLDRHVALVGLGDDGARWFAEREDALTALSSWVAEALTRA